MKYLIIIILTSISFTILAQNETFQFNDDPNFKVLFGPNLNSGISCYRIPSMVTAPNGDLIVACDERVPSCGDLKWNDNINIVVRRSTDNGVIWSDMETVIDYPNGKSASDPSMIVDYEIGTIFLFFNFMDLENEKDIYYLKVMKSTDNGMTWSEPIDITSQITKSDWHNDFKFITSGRGIQTKKGKLLHTLVNLKKGLHIFGSSDHGESWNLIESALIPGDESKLVELNDGTLMVNSRVNGQGYRYVHLSSDQGKTWISKLDSTLLDPGCNAGFLKFSSVNEGADQNRLLFSNLNSGNDRKILTLKLSYDEGVSWTEKKTVYSGSSAYSSMTILANGNIGLVFEKDDYKEIVFAELTLHWITDGKDNYRKINKE